MGSVERTLAMVLRGTSDANIAFDDLRQLLLRLGFDERTKGSHHIFRRAGIPERINLQRDGKKAKPYQVRQVRQMIVKHKLAGEIDG
jgi:predicted RNA binding protein YcfA (HicA-like mRNA interferase family)